MKAQADYTVLFCFVFLINVQLWKSTECIYFKNPLVSIFFCCIYISCLHGRVIIQFLMVIIALFKCYDFMKTLLITSAVSILLFFTDLK